jgi:hypothetical protein
MSEPNASLPAVSKTCLVISPYGRDAKEQKHFDQALKHLIKPTLESEGYVVTRFDEIDEPGLITSQIIERLLDDDLVVADLTDRNPNVYYELAVRHAAGKPVIHILRADQDLPFDVSNVRAVKYSITDPDELESARQDLAAKARAIVGGQVAANPITAARRAAILQASDLPGRPHDRRDRPATFPRFPRSGRSQRSCRP